MRSKNNPNKTAVNVTELSLKKGLIYIDKVTNNSV